jgi:hypothetical protein
MIENYYKNPTIKETLTFFEYCGEDLTRIVNTIQKHPEIFKKDLNKRWFKVAADFLEKVAKKPGYAGQDEILKGLDEIKEQVKNLKHKIDGTWTDL